MAGGLQIINRSFVEKKFALSDERKYGINMYYFFKLRRQSRKDVSTDFSLHIDPDLRSIFGDSGFFNFRLSIIDGFSTTPLTGNAPPFSI